MAYVELSLGHDGVKLGVEIKAVSRGRSFRYLNELLHDFVINAFLDENSGAGSTHLTSMVATGRISSAANPS